MFAAAVLSAVLPPDLRAQEPAVPVKRAYVEVFGAGLLYSINYEVPLSDRIGLRLGVGGLPLPGVSYAVGLGMPTMLLGRGQHRGVVAAGVGLGWLGGIDVLESQDVFFAYGIASIGYQFQPSAQGFFFRASFTPIFTDQSITPWGGASFGRAF